MGCCHSKGTVTAIEKLKESQTDELQTLKAGEAAGLDKSTEPPRPASSTQTKDSNGKDVPGSNSRSQTPRSETPTDGNQVAAAAPSKKGAKKKPAGLSTKQLMDPNMIVTTPNRPAGAADFPIGDANMIEPLRGGKNRHQEDLNRLPFFVPLDKPAGGAPKKPPNLSSSKKKKKKKSSTVDSIPGGEKKHKQQVFIPGSGNERILLADKSKTLSKLPPLHFAKVEGSAEVKSSIAADRQKAADRKKQVVKLNRFMKEELGFDATVASLIRQYAEISKVVKPEVEIFEDNARSHVPSHSRTTISCPIKKPG